MANPTLNLAELYGPAQVRQAELLRAILDAETEVLPTRERELSIVDLLLGLEFTALAADAGTREVQTGYLNEHYGLLPVLTDPFLRPLLPTIPGTGASIRYRIRSLNGRPRVFNESFLIASSASLESALSPA